jgi:hypothetical protein
MFVKRFLLENPLVALIWIRGVWVGTFEREGRSAGYLHLLDFSNATLLITLVYPDRLPFYLASLTPFWLIPVAGLPRDRWIQPLWARLRAGYQRSVLVVTAALLAIGVVGWNYQILFNHNADAHHAFVGWLRSHERELAPLRVYDPAGVIPFLPVDHWFMGPGEVHNQDVVERIKSHPPDVILTTNKIYLISRQLAEFLRQNYWWDHAGILIHRHILDFPPVREIKGAEFLQHLQPFIVDRNGAPLENFVVELYTADALDFSRHAQWHDAQGVRPYDPHVHLSDFTADLTLPPGVRYAAVYPLKITTPFNLDWPELFRFDAEN